MKARACLILLVPLLLAVTLVEPVQYNASSLDVRTTAEGDSTRKDFIRDGVITFAADKGYATMVKTGSLEEYFDEKGAPVTLPAGYSKVSEEHGLITYMDESGDPVVIDEGYDSVHRTYTESGRADTDTYYVGANQVEHKKRYWGYKRVYEGDRLVEVRYLDRDGNLSPSDDGYAVLRRTYSESGQTDMYFGANGEPAHASIGQYGVYKEFDESGRTIVTTYLDADGQPMDTARGYATVRTSYEDGTVRQYYDAAGSPTTAGSYQYGIQEQDGQNVLLDEGGEPLVRLDTFLRRHLFLVAVAGAAVTVAAVMVRGRWRAAFIVLYVGFILFMTLWYREPRDPHGKLELFWSYRQFFSSVSLRREILQNVWLFVPLGAALSRNRLGLLWALGLSVAIEAAQYALGLGLAEFDDVVSNVLGAAIGIGFGIALGSLIDWVVSRGGAARKGGRHLAKARR